jgi:hypothetical protein
MEITENFSEYISGREWRSVVLEEGRAVSGLRQIIRLSLKPLVRNPNRRTTPCRLSSTAPALYTQLPSRPGGSFLELGSLADSHSELIPKL